MEPETSAWNQPDVIEPIDPTEAKLNRRNEAYNIHKYKLIISVFNTTLLSVFVETCSFRGSCRRREL